MLYNALTRHAGFFPDGLWTLIYVLWIVGGTVFLLLHRRRPTTMLAWLLAFWSVPILSGLAYFLFGPRRLDDEGKLRQRARQAAARVVPPSAHDLPEDFIENCSLASLARVTRSSVETESESAPRRARSIELYADGDGAFPAILKAIHEATDTLHLEYYIWLPDGIGTEIRNAVIGEFTAGTRNNRAMLV